MHGAMLPRWSSFLAGALLLLGVSSAGAQDWRTMARGREFRGEPQLKVKLEYGAGHLRIEPAGKDVLYRASMRYDADVFEPQMRFAGNELHLGMGNGEIRGKRNMKGGSLDLRLGSGVPLDLDLKFGAADADLDLGGLRIRTLEIGTGASDTRLRFSQPNPVVCESAKFEVGAARFEATGLGNLNARNIQVSGGVGEVVLDFTGRGRQDLTADIHMGLGSLTLRVPRGLGLRVEKDGLLTGFDSEGLIKRGNVYYSEQYDRAGRKLSVTLDAAFGSIKVVWVGAQ